MSLTDDQELQDLVKQCLEKSGSMSRIRAELRANVFLALEENGCFQNLKSKNTDLQNFAKNADGLLLLCLIREFLEYFGLSFTTSVFDPELASYGIECNCKDHIKLSDQLNISSDSADEKNGPLLCQMLQVIRNFQSKVQLQKPNIYENFEENSHIQTCKSTDTSTEYYPLQPVLQSSKVAKNTESSKKKYPKTESTMKSNSKNNINKINSDMKINSTSSQHSDIVFGKDTDFSKLSLSSLGDLPPLSSQSSSAKNSLSPLNKSSKQINKLKAMLIDSTSSDNNGDIDISNSSVISDDEKEGKKIFDISEIDGELFGKEE